MWVGEGGGEGGEGVVKKLGEGEVRVAGDRKAIQVSPWQQRDKHSIMTTASSLPPSLPPSPLFLPPSFPLPLSPSPPPSLPPFLPLSLPPFL